MSAWVCPSCSTGLHYCDWFNSDLSERCACACPDRTSVNAERVSEANE